MTQISDCIILTACQVCLVSMSLYSYLTSFKPKADISLTFVSIPRVFCHNETMLYTQLSYICLVIYQYWSCLLLSIDFTPHVSSYSFTP